MCDLSDVFKLNSGDVLKYFNDKLPEKYDFDKMRFSAYNRTFLIEGIREMQILKQMHAILKKAYQNSMSFKDCVAELQNVSGLHEEGLIAIFNQNIRQIYNFARYEKQLLSDKPYLCYVATKDNGEEDNHKDFHGLILPKEHDFWRNNYPPNGWGCTCEVRSLSQDETKALDYKKNAQDPGSLSNPAESGFDNNPIEPDNALFKALEEKVKNVSDELKKSAKRIMNNAYRDYTKTQDLYKKLKASYDEFKLEYDAFVEQKLKELNLKKIEDDKKNVISEAFSQKIKAITEKLKAENKREHAFIEIAKLNGASVFIDKYQIATHLKHRDITPLDYALIDRIIKEGNIDEEQSRQRGKTIIRSILGRKYKLVLRPNEGRYLVDSLIFESEK